MIIGDEEHMTGAEMSAQSCKDKVAANKGFLRFPKVAITYFNPRLFSSASSTEVDVGSLYRGWVDKRWSTMHLTSDK